MCTHFYHPTFPFRFPYSENSFVLAVAQWDELSCWKRSLLVTTQRRRAGSAVAEAGGGVRVPRAHGQRERRQESAARALQLGKSFPGALQRPPLSVNSLTRASLVRRARKRGFFLSRRWRRPPRTLSEEDFQSGKGQERGETSREDSRGKENRLMTSQWKNFHWPREEQTFRFTFSSQVRLESFRASSTAFENKAKDN